LLALRAVSGFATGGLRALARAVMALAVTVVMRTALVGTSARPPDLDELRFGRRLGFRLGLGFSFRLGFDGRGFCNGGFSGCFGCRRR
ncbi:hypothetical protein, partial [Bradyrhizobium lablabi]|uniref:hypothetical protein n=1 Tax=Bradyrhizobium lablabi TaxID=722472 RepID=UPI003D320728